MSIHLPSFAPQALILLPTVLNSVLYAQLVTNKSGSASTKSKSALLLGISLAEIGIVLALNLGYKSQTNLTQSAGINWAAWMHYSFTGIQFTTNVILAALAANRPPWIFVLIAGNQLSRLYSTIVTSFTGVQSPTLLEILSVTVKYTLRHWSWLLPLDMAGGVFVFLLWNLLSADKVPVATAQNAEAVESATKQQKNEHAAKLLVTFGLTSAFAVLSDSTDYVLRLLSHWPESLMFRFTPPAAPVIIDYFRPRWALLAIVLGVKVRQLVLQHVQVRANEGQAEQKVKLVKKQQ